MLIFFMLRIILSLLILFPFMIDFILLENCDTGSSMSMLIPSKVKLFTSLSDSLYTFMKYFADSEKETFLSLLKLVIPLALFMGVWCALNSIPCLSNLSLYAERNLFKGSLTTINLKYVFNRCWISSQLYWLKNLSLWCNNSLLVILRLLLLVRLSAIIVAQVVLPDLFIGQ